MYAVLLDLHQHLAYMQQHVTLSRPIEATAILVVPVRVELTLEPYESPVRTTRRHHMY